MWNQFGQRLAVEQFHGDIHQTVGLADIVDDADRWMIERGRQPGLADEPGPGALVLESGARQDFYRDVALESRIARAIHLAHPACAQRTDDLVRAEAGAGRQPHRVSVMWPNCATDRGRFAVHWTPLGAMQRARVTARPRDRGRPPNVWPC